VLEMSGLGPDTTKRRDIVKSGIKSRPTILRTERRLDLMVGKANFILADHKMKEDLDVDR